jgi:hypothetical protein
VHKLSLCTQASFCAAITGAGLIGIRLHAGLLQLYLLTAYSGFALWSGVCLPVLYIMLPLGCFMLRWQMHASSWTCAAGVALHSKLVMSVNFGGKSCRDCLGDRTKGLSDNVCCEGQTRKQPCRQQGLVGYLGSCEAVCYSCCVAMERKGCSAFGGLGCQALCGLLRAVAASQGVCRTSHRNRYRCHSKKVVC